MCELKRTQLYEAHLAAGGTMVDFGGWEMPIQYPSGIVTEHLTQGRGWYTMQFVRYERAIPAVAEKVIAAAKAEE